MVRLVAVYSSLGLLLLAGATRSEDAKKELEKLQGTWDIIEVVNNGQTTPQDKVKGGHVVFQGDEMTVRDSSNDKNPRKFRFKLNPKEKPKAIDMTSLNGKYKGAVNPAIYQLDGDILKVCSPNGPDTKDRPTELKSENGSS